MIEWEEKTGSLEDTSRVAARLAAAVAPGTAILLYGELGAGKTEFVRGFVAALDPGVKVSSPTFTLVNTYPTNPPIYHLDLYRTNSHDDLVDLGLDEYLAGDGIVLIEWAEKCDIAEIGAHVSVRIAIVSGRERQISIRSAG